ncbi:TPA: hypothetical protein QCX47_003062 [Bacillus mycoides]|nr:hypothetical protein [Bacillus mycoides]
MSEKTCTYCVGHGKRHNGYFEYPCNHCRGKGTVQKNNFPTFIPSENQVLTLDARVENYNDFITSPNKTNEHNERK